MEPNPSKSQSGLQWHGYRSLNRQIRVPLRGHLQLGFWTKQRSLSMTQSSTSRRLELLVIVPNTIAVTFDTWICCSPWLGCIRRVVFRIID